MFDDRYEAILADNDEGKDVHYGLRYQVYCVEKGFEATSSECADPREMDEFDDYSAHFVVRDRITDTWLGTVRLVCANPKGLPIERIAELPEGLTSNGKVAEMSRLSILQPYRQVGQEARSSGAVNEPEVMLGLIRAARAYSMEKGVTQWVFLCRRSISRILGGVGMSMRQIGPACEFRGVRYPFLMDVQSDFNGLADKSLAAEQMFNRRSAYVRYSELTPVLVPERIAKAA